MCDGKHSQAYVINVHIVAKRLWVWQSNQSNLALDMPHTLKSATI